MPSAAAPNFASPAPTDPNDLGEMVLRSSPLSDDRLADLFEADGRRRILAGLDCPLRRYIDLIPDSRTFPIAVDSAIDVSLRALARKEGLPAPLPRHADLLSSDFPSLVESIRLAALLSQSIVTTQGLHRRAETFDPPPLPREIGPFSDDGHPRYLLTDLLGRGSSGTVCRAVDRLLSDEDNQAKVAVKLIPVDKSDANLLLHYAQEATKARRIEHANVVRVLDRGVTAEGEVYVVSDLIDGGDLQSHITQRGLPFPPREAAKLVAAIADGVQAAHTVGLIHADLKPANIVLTKDGIPKVVDFGLATSLQAPWFSLAGSPDNTPQPVAGNLAFIAPEQFRAEQDAVAPAADLYALAGILVHLITGEYPNGATATEIARRHETTSHSTAYTLPATRTGTKPIDSTLAAIAARSLHPNPARRHTSAAEFAADLRAWLEHRPIAWQRRSVAARTALAVRRRPWVSAALTVTTLAAGAGLFGAGIYFRRAEELSERQAEARASVFQRLQEMQNDAKKGVVVSDDELRRKSLESLQKVHKLTAPGAETHPAEHPKPAPRDATPPTVPPTAPKQ